MKAKELARRFAWTVFCGDGEREILGGYAGDMLSRVMCSCGKGFAWITVQTSQNMLAVAEFAEVACVILPEGIGLSEEVRKRAQDEGITVYGSERGAFELAAELSGGIRVGKAVL